VFDSVDFELSGMVSNLNLH